MFAVPSVSQVLALCSAVSLVTVVTSCHCPEESCMRIANVNRRCECCVFVFLGKRSGGPSTSDVSERDRDVESDKANTNKRKASYVPPFYILLQDLTKSAQTNDHNGNASPHHDRPAVSPAVDMKYNSRSFGLDLKDEDGTVGLDEIPKNRMWYNVLLNSMYSDGNVELKNK